MKNIVAISFLLLLASCFNQKRKDLVERTIKLKNNVGTISISLPLEFDTLLEWQKHSDYHCGDKQCFRIQSSKFSLECEDSYFADYYPDTFYGVVIIQPSHEDCVFDCSSIDNEEDLERMKSYQREIYRTKAFVFSEVMKFDSVSVVVLGCIDTLHGIFVQRLRAGFCFNQRIIEIRFVNNTLNFQKDSFLQKSYESLKTIRFTN